MGKYTDQLKQQRRLAILHIEKVYNSDEVQREIKGAVILIARTFDVGYRVSATEIFTNDLWKREFTRLISKEDDRFYFKNKGQAKGLYLHYKESED